jgi:cytochrome b subunit of formate dehydrogenase
MMNFLVQWGINPWGEDTLIHAQWGLVYVAFAFGIGFMVAHTLFVKFWPKPEGPVTAPLNETAAARVPGRVTRHSLAARMFHWIMAASMLTLLGTASAPVLGLQFNWIEIHWIAGLVLTVSIVYHIVHASYWLDFWSIWLNKEDVGEAITRLKRAMGRSAPAPRKAAKYPWDNKMYHTAIVLSALASVPTGLFMMFRVETALFTRNPYLFSDTTWGLMYVLHGLSGIGLVGLTLAHIYFAIRPEKRWITKGMIFGDISRQEFLHHHDPERWIVETGAHGGAEQQRL